VNREPVTKPPKPLTKSETAALVSEIHELLSDPDVSLSVITRARWEGALSALEAVLGLRPSIVVEDPGLL
jgi:hypothetical protein